MLRIPLAAAGILAIGASSFGQQTYQQLNPAPVVRNAGTYHVATDTWTRGATGAAAWDDIIYDNACTTNYWAGMLPTNTFVDEGRIPSTSSPTVTFPPVALSWTGTQNQYTVNWFQVKYCTYDANPTWVYNFYETFNTCGGAWALTPTATVAFANMPGGGGSGAVMCWLVNLDLVNSGLDFPMLADGDGVWSNGTGDRFGWSSQQPGASPFGNPGPMITGDPRGYLNAGPGTNGCDVGANTAFYGGSLPNTEGTGLGTDDAWEENVVSPTPANVNCWYWGGYYALNLFASFHMVIAAETGAGPVEPGFAYCPGDGIAPHTLCPCGNSNNGSMGGCDWGNASFPEGGVLTAQGDDLHANADVMLIASGIQNNFGIFFGANIQVNSGNGNPLNDGLRCAGGGLIRLTPPTAATGNTASHGPIETSDVSAAPGVTRRYQYWFRTPGGPCGTSANLTNGYEIAWL